MRKVPYDELFLMGMEHYEIAFVGELFTTYGKYDPKIPFNTNSGFVFRVDEIIKGKPTPYVDGPWITDCGFKRLHYQFKDTYYGEVNFELGKKYLILGSFSGNDFFFSGSRLLSDSSQILLKYGYNQRVGH